MKLPPKSVGGPGPELSNSETGAGQRFRLRSSAAICELDTSSSTQMYQLVLPERRFQIDVNVRSVLGFLAIARKRNELVEFMKELAPDEDPEERSNALLSELGKLGAVVGVDQKGDELPLDPSVPAVRRKNPLTIHVRLFKREQILPLSSRLKSLFDPGPGATLLAIIILTHAVFLILDKVVGAHHLAHGAPLSSGAWLSIVLSVYVSLLFHELGHCAACERFGIEHGEIGVGVFFVYPVFYADVGPCWFASRLRRAVVDAAGIYLQLIVSSIICLIWFFTGARLARLFVYSTLLCTIVNLNPFLRMDGYWLLADLLGLPSLYRASNDVLTHAIKCAIRLVKPRGRASEPPETLRRPRWMLLVVALYAVSSIVFFGGLTWQMMTGFIPRLITALPLQFSLIWKDLSAHGFTAHLGQLAVAAFFLCVSALGASRFALGTLRRLWNSELLRPIWITVSRFFIQRKTVSNQTL